MDGQGAEAIPGRGCRDETLLLNSSSAAADISLALVLPAEGRQNLLESLFVVGGLTMPPLDEDGRMEYAALMSRGSDAERISQFCWVAAGVAATVLLSWAIEAKSSGLMLPVVFAVAFGFYATLRSRQQIRLIGGYVEEYFEGRGAAPQWFSRLRLLQNVPGFNSSNNWLAAFLANAVNLTAVVLAWVYAPTAARGELMAGIVTGCGVAFAFHSISETSRLDRTHFPALWRQVSGELREERRPSRVAGR